MDDNTVQRTLDRIYTRLDTLQGTADENRESVKEINRSILGSDGKPGLAEDVRTIRAQQTAMMKQNGNQDKRLEEHDKKLSRLTIWAIIISLVIAFMLIIGSYYLLTCCR